MLRVPHGFEDVDLEYVLIGTVGNGIRFTSARPPG